METYGVTIAGETYDIDAPDEKSLRKAVTRLYIEKTSEENARRGSNPRERSRLREDSSFADVMAWRQNAMGDLGRSEPQTPQEAKEGGWGAATGLAVAGTIAAPVAAAKAMGRGATAYAVEEGVDLGAQAAGVSPYWSDKIADAAGILSFIGPGKLVKFIQRLGRKKAKEELKESLVQVVVKNEKERLRASAVLRGQGYTQAQIDKAVVMGSPKIPTKLATSPPVAPKAPAPPAPAAPAPAPRAPAPSAPAPPAPAAPSGRTLDPLKGVNFNKAGGSKAQRAAVDAKAAYEGKSVGGAGWTPWSGSGQYPFEPAKAAVEKTVKKAASAGAVRAAEHKVLVTFAKQEAKGAKFGEKIWIELNKAGEPLRVMTPGQASHVAEGLKTWIKRMWK